MSVNKLHRNPGAWLTLALLAMLTFLFFRESPIVASIFCGILALLIATALICSSLRLRRRGYRVSGCGPDSLCYLERTSSGETRRLTIGYGNVAKGKVGIYWPSREAWADRMPDWAQGRRDEIFERVRKELGEKLVKCIEME